jgi:hypothetical protein
MPDDCGQGSKRLRRRIEGRAALASSWPLLPVRIEGRAAVGDRRQGWDYHGPDLGPAGPGRAVVLRYLLGFVLARRLARASEFVRHHEVTWGCNPGHGGGDLLFRRSWSADRIKVVFVLGFLSRQDEDLSVACFH